MMPFELLLKGERLTLIHHLAYGLLEEKFPDAFASGLAASALQDHHWRMMAAWMTQKWNQTLDTLDNRVFLALSCLGPFPKQVKVSEYTSPKQAASAFMATGTFYEWYDGMPCTDGGAESGKNMTPLFEDGLRGQFVVNLMQTGFPDNLVFKYNMTQYEALIRRGQDVAGEMLSCGATNPKCWSTAFSFCPRGNATAAQVCAIGPHAPS